VDVGKADFVWELVDVYFQSFAASASKYPLHPIQTGSVFGVVLSASRSRSLF